MRATRELFSPQYAYKKAGVVITKLIQQEDASGVLFCDPVAAERDERLSRSIDSLARSYGRGTVRFGVQGDGRIRNALEHQSPHYTTLWSDIPSASVK